MQSSKKIKRGAIEDYISNSTQSALNELETTIENVDANTLHTEGNEVKNGNLTLNNDLILPNIVTDTTIDVMNLGISTITNRIVAIPIDENLEISATNKTGATISKGSIVYVNGAQGSKPTIALALADANIATSLAIGVVKEDILNNTSGYIVTNGIVDRLDTSAFTEGDKVFVSPTIPGGMTTTIPTSPNNVVFIGTVTNSHSTQGKILVSVAYTFKLDRLVDVAINTPLDNNILSYESTTGLWKNKTLTSLGGTTGTGTINYLSKWGSTTGLTNSSIFDNGTSLGVGTVSPLTKFNIDKTDQTIGSSIPNGAFILTNNLYTGVGLEMGITNAADVWIQSRLTINSNSHKLSLNPSGGNILIGSTIDDGINKLQVNGRSIFKDEVIIDNGTNGRFSFTNSTNNDFQSTTTGFGAYKKLRIIASEIGFNTGLAPTEKASILSNGNILINTGIDNLVDKLQVNGTASFATEGIKIGTTSFDEKLLQLNNASLSTGLYEFGSGGLTNNSTTSFNIGNVKGWIVNSADPLNATPVFINFAGIIGQTTPYLATHAASYVMITPLNTVSILSSRPTVTQRRDNIFLGVVGHPNGAIGGIGNSPDIIMNVMSQVRAMFEPIRFINGGILCYANGSDLQLANSGGTLYGLGIGFTTNGNNAPSTLNIPSGSPSVFQYRTQIGTVFANTSFIEPIYVDIAGVRTVYAGSGNQATNQRIYLLQNGAIRIQYGQTVYSTLANAISEVATESFVEVTNNRNLGTLIGVVSVTKGCTNLSDTSTARFLPASKIGEIIGAAAGISVGTLQTGYNNAINPEIITNSSLGAVTIRRGSASDSNTVLEIQDGAGVTTASINGIGEITSNAYILSGAGVIDALLGNGDTIALTSGSFSPNVLDPVNVTTVVSPITGRYTRVGNIVTAYVGFTINVAATGATASFSIALPINRSTATQMFMGTGSLMGSLNPHIAVTLESSNTSRVNVLFNKSAVGTDSLICSFTYSYSVLD